MLIVAALFGSPAKLEARTKLSPSEGPDCEGFGGRIHGRSSCVRLDLRTGQVSPLEQRVAGPGSTRCNATLNIAGHVVAIKCDMVPRSPPNRHVLRVEIRASVDGRPQVSLDTHEGYWDFINIWFRENKQKLELTIDYGVDD